MTKFVKPRTPGGQPAAVQKEGPVTIADIKHEAGRMLHAAAQDDLFMVHTANNWMERSKMRPTPQMLFSEFWHEGELCILFADTNLGKSILAVQIGDSISKGVEIPGFTLRSQAQPVLYFDFELSEKQFESRYSCDYAEHYKFDGSFYRAEINPDADLPEASGQFEEYLNRSIEETINRTGAKVLIIDNLTYLKNETEKAHNALPLMKHLKALKQRYGLSILALAHTPKRDASKPITKNDLQGSKMLMNFCDSAFAIGESHSDKNARYLKQIKQRYTECVYDTGNVVICQTSKPGNFLQFEMTGYGTEWEHLKKVSDDEQDELQMKVKEMMEAAPGTAVFEIAKRLCPDGVQFNSFRVKVDRIAKRIRNSA